MQGYELIFFLGIGSIVGLLSGMLGIGGGVIAVPLLIWVFTRSGFPALYLVQIATATSLAVMACSMLVSVWAHRSHIQESWVIFRSWVGPLLVGAVTGIIVAHHLHSDWLTLIFGLFLIVIATKTFFSFSVSGHCALPNIWAMRSAGFLMGTLASMLGIGGGAIMLPYLSYYQVEMRRAIVVVAMSGCLVATISTALAMYLGWHQRGLPEHTFGYVYWPAWLGLIIGSIGFIPVGLYLAKRLPVQLLQKIFAVILLCTGLQMVLSYAALSFY